MNKQHTGPACLGLRGEGAGKGDVDRSPGWREHYDEINWPRSNDGFEQLGVKRQRKRYGTERKPTRCENE